MTGAARRRRGRWRRAKSRRKLERPDKDLGRCQMKPIEQDESAQAEQPDRLLLSALRYWEVKRDLIEERLATSRSAMVHS